MGHQYPIPVRRMCHAPVTEPPCGRYARVSSDRTIVVMAKPKRSAVQRYHDRVAPRYDHSYDDDFWRWHDALTWDYLKPHLPVQHGAAVVDLGCGTGKWAAKLLKSGYAVTCVDISQRMLDQARSKLDRQGEDVRATYVQADLMDLSMIDDGAFALATALGDPLACTESPLRALKEIRRILRTDGVLVATFDNRLAAIDYYLEQGDAAQLARFLRDGRTNWFTKNVEEQFPLITHTPQNVCRLVEKAGFAVVDLVGKTVLPMRKHRQLLSDPKARRDWSRIEKSLCRGAEAMGRASHIQVAARAVDIS